jgi:hypothetical protein
MTTLSAQYEHSGNVARLRTFAGIAASLVAVIATAWLYAVINIHIRYVWVSALLPFAFGGALAYLNVWALRFGKVRDTQTARRITLATVTFGYYMYWAAWFGVLMPEITTMDTAVRPVAVALEAVNAPQNYEWTLFDARVSGGWLVLFWVIEAAIVFLMGIAIARSRHSDLPFCERCDNWCTKQRNIARLWSEDRDAVTNAVREKNTTTLASFVPVPLSDEVGRWYEFDLEVCPGCGETITLDVHEVKATRDSKGEITRNATQFVSNIMLSPAEASEFRSLGRKLVPAFAVHAGGDAADAPPAAWSEGVRDPVE